MNSKLKKFFSNPQGKCAAILGASLLLLGSCAEGYESPDGFDAGVRNTQLVTPPSDSIRFEVNPAGDKATISWPLVVGAKNYEVTFKNVDDPANPFIVDGLENYLVDGSSVTVSVTEDSKYELSMRVIADESKGNKSDSVIVTSLTTLVPSIMTIPSGSDIAQYIAENPIDSSYMGKEVAIDLEANGEYTLSGPVNFHGQKMTFRGDKIYRPVVKMTGAGALYCYSMVKVKYINFDFAESTAKSFFFVSNENLPDSLKGSNMPKYSGPKFQKGNYMLEEPFYFAHCWFKDMPGSIFHDNQVKCAIWYLTISDCIVQLNRGTDTPSRGYGEQAFISLEKGGAAIKHLVIEESTIFNIKDHGAYFLRYANNSNAQAVKAFGQADASYSTITTDFRNTTFSRVFSGGKWWNNTSGNGQITTVDHCVFHNMSPGQIARRITGTKTYKFNFWQGEGTDHSGYKDSYGAPFAALYDDIFLGTFDQSLDFTQPNGGVNFTPNQYVVVENRGGDPRWLPEVSAETDENTTPVE